MHRSLTLVASLAVAGVLFAAGGKLPPNVPNGAVEVTPGVYRFVDKEKKAWIYRPTPFGYAKSEETAEKREAPPAPAGRPEGSSASPFGESKPGTGAPATTAVEVGDSVRFERLTPFGVTRWTKKKNELTEDERRIVDAQRASTGAQDNPTK